MKDEQDKLMGTWIVILLLFNILFFYSWRCKPWLPTCHSGMIVSLLLTSAKENFDNFHVENNKNTILQHFSRFCAPSTHLKAFNCSVAKISALVHLWVKRDGVIYGVGGKVGKF